MSARNEAVQAMRAALREARDCEWFGEDEVLPHALDAIPADVLARLAVERGGLVPCAYRWREGLFGSWVVHHWEPTDGAPSEPVYRIAEAPSADEEAPARPVEQSRAGAITKEKRT